MPHCPDNPWYSWCFSEHGSADTQAHQAKFTTGISQLLTASSAHPALHATRARILPHPSMAACCGMHAMPKSRASEVCGTCGSHCVWFSRLHVIIVEQSPTQLEGGKSACHGGSSNHSQAKPKGTRQMACLRNGLFWQLRSVCLRPAPNIAVGAGTDARSVGQPCVAASHHNVRWQHEASIQYRFWTESLPETP